MHVLGQIIAGVVAGVAATLLLLHLLTGRRRTSQRQLEERARRAERMAEAGMLAGGLAHEIKNPLSTLRMNLELMREDLQNETNPRVRRVLRRLDALDRESRRLEESLQDFLNYARGQRLQVATVDVNELVDELLTFAEPLVDASGIQIRTHLDPGTGAIEADANQLKQALMNLVINAEQVMPDGGELIVTTARTDDGVQIELTDTGKGIPPDDIDRIFQAYYSTKTAGSGLGLATTRRIVEDHGGSISVHSDEGKGSRFTIVLPSIPPDADRESQ